MSSSVRNFSRRDFLKTSAVFTGSTLVLGTFVGCKPMAPHLLSDATFEPNAFITINTAGDVTVIAHRSEMGQGIRTGLPAVVADELEVDWSRVTVAQATGDAKYGNQDTDGSRSVRQFYRPMREAGAAAREMLVAAAAQQWGVPAEECRAENHEVHHEASGRKLGYGALVETAATLPVPEAPTLKDPSQFKYIGKPLHGVDNTDIVTGKAVYGLDVNLPDMLHAVMVRCPVVGGTVKSVGDAAASAVPGVRDVIEVAGGNLPPLFFSMGGVAVIAEHTWAALKGREQLDIQWELGANAAYDSEAYRATLDASLAKKGEPVREEGNVDAGFRSAAQVVEARYDVPMLAHASMEPPCAVAAFNAEANTCEVWAPTQGPQRVQGQVADALQIPAENVTVHVTLLGGGFGRKSKPDYVREAAVLSKAVGAPIKLTWTREDDLQHDYYHAVSAQYLRAGLDANGRATAWLHRTAFPSISSTFAPDVLRPSDGEMGLGCIDVPYEIENICCERGEAPAHVRIGWVRSVSNIHHAFAIASFADELAHAAGRDPKDYLLELVGTPRTLNLTNYGADTSVYPYDTARIRNVIERVTQEAGWGKALPDRRGLGLAFHYSFVTYVAQVVDASVDDEGRIRVHRVDCAVDCGTVVNPDRVRAQMEGAIVFGLTLALHGKITAKGGRVEQSNFHDYPLLRLNEMPEVHIHLIESTAPPTGVGEPGVPPLAPALANAIFAATGQRLRELPLRVG